MTSRERLLTALQGRKPDRVPANLYEVNPYAEGTFYTTEEPWKEIIEFLKKESDSFGWGGVDSGIFCSDPTKMTARYTKKEEGNSVFHHTEIETSKGILSSDSRTDEGVATTWQLKHFIETDEDIEKFLSLEYRPYHGDLVNFKKLEEVMKENDRGVMIISLGDAICSVAGIMDFEFFAMKCFEDKKTILGLIDVFQERLLYFYEFLAKNLKDTVFRICGPEYATPPLLPPSYFHELVALRDRELSGVIRKYSENRNFVCIHSHNKIGKVLDEIVSIGVDVLEPVESLPASTADITFEEVRNKVGDSVCLMGNIQTRYLDYCSPEELDAIIKTTIYEGGKKGAFVLIPTGAPIVSPLPEKTHRNIFQYFESVHKYGQYPLK